MLKNFRCYQMAKEIHQMCEKLPIKGEVKSQLNRATLSIVLNLAEGSGKFEKNEQRRFFKIAFASIRETQAILDLLNAHEIAAKVDSLAAATWRLIRPPE
jgi:four helix bundle protein